jgi:site-specific recombinase XerD
MPDAQTRAVTTSAGATAGSHALRHGAATYTLAAGVDVKPVQERLGHSTSALTRDVCTLVLPDVARAAAEARDAMIPSRRVHP